MTTHIVSLPTGDFPPWSIPFVNLCQCHPFCPPSDSYRPLLPSFDDLATTSRFTLNEAEDAYEFTMDAPGFKKSEVKVSVDSGQLSVVAVSEKKGKSLSRSITLPSDADTAEVVAALEDGILTVTIKKASRAQSREIELQ